MSITWAGNTGEHIDDMVAAVGQAIAGEAPARAEAKPEDLFMGDRYLAENVGQMRAGWEINPWAVVPGGRIFDLFQRAVRRLTWWHTRPQLDQVSRFNSAAVRALEALLVRVLRLSQRMHALEASNSETRMRTFEEQLRAAREEHARLAHRVAQLESELAALRSRAEG